MKRALIISAFIAATATTSFAGGGHGHGHGEKHRLPNSFWTDFNRGVDRLTQVGHVGALKNDAVKARRNPTCENLKHFRDHWQSTREVMSNTWRQLRTLKSHINRYCS